jgi:endoglucanase
MPFSLKVVLLCIVSLVIVAAVFVPYGHAYAATASLPYNATANGPYSVHGNRIVGANGKQYIFHGIGRDSLEYNCRGDSFLSQQYLAYMGSGPSTGTGTYWDANTVRLPLSEGFWLYGDVAAPGSPPSAGCSSSYYHSLVKQIVNSLTSLKLNVILDLQWSDAIDTSGHVQSWRGGGT